jgi:hypothetical protein
MAEAVAGSEQTMTWPYYIWRSANPVRRKRIFLPHISQHSPGVDQPCRTSTEHYVLVEHGHVQARSKRAAARQVLSRRYRWDSHICVTAVNAPEAHDCIHDVVIRLGYGAKGETRTQCGSTLAVTGDGHA